MSGDSVDILHHVYGSTPSGFTTLLSPAGLDRRSVLELERRSGYAVPLGIPADDPELLPGRHVFHLLGDYVVVGRAVYLGIDQTGRLGNYVCHSLLLKAADALPLFDDPTALLSAVEAAGLFLNAAYVEGAVLPAQARLDASASRVTDVTPSAVLDVLTACLAWSDGAHPIFVCGEDRDALALIRASLSLLPHSVRWKLPFDTYVYGGDARELAFAGLPPAPEYSRGIIHWTLRFDTATGITSWNERVTQKPIASYLATLQHAEPSMRDAALSCIDLIDAGNWAELGQDMALVDTTGKRALYSSYRDRLITHIESSEDIDLLAVLVDAVPDVDLSRLANSGISRQLTQRPSVRARIVGATMSLGAASPLFPLVAADDGLTSDLLERLGHVQEGETRLPYLSALLGDPTMLDRGLERPILLAVGAACAIRSPDAASASTMISAIRALGPASPAETGLREYALSMLGDRDALRRFLDRGTLVASSAELPAVTAAMMRTAVRSGMRLQGQLDALVAAGANGDVPIAAIGDVCRAVLNDPGIDERPKRRFAKDLIDALGGVPSQPWSIGLVESARAHAGDDVFGFLRKEEK